MTLISQGAEAKIELVDGKVLKERVPKSYRHPDLDATLRKSRTKREEKVMKKARELGIGVPEIFDNQDKFTISMQFIDGKRFRDYIFGGSDVSSSVKQIGEWIATLHDNDIIHGDLTTSNILVDKQNNLFLIDFGLSFFSKRIEDKAVDLHVFEENLESTHYKEKEELFSAFLEGYKVSPDFEEVIKRLAVVKSRGRNKH